MKEEDQDIVEMGLQDSSSRGSRWATWACCGEGADCCFIHASSDSSTVVLTFKAGSWP